MIGCPYLNKTTQKLLSDHILAQVRDIEELAAEGDVQQGLIAIPPQHNRVTILTIDPCEACPYYGSRTALPAAELVVAPYNAIFHKSTREAFGIDLKGLFLKISLIAFQNFPLIHMRRQYCDS